MSATVTGKATWEITTPDGRTRREVRDVVITYNEKTNKPKEITVSKVQRKKLAVNPNVTTKPPKSRTTVRFTNDWYWHAESSGRIVADGGEGYVNRSDACRAANLNAPAVLPVYVEINGGKAYLLIRPALLTRKQIACKVVK